MSTADEDGIPKWLRAIDPVAAGGLPVKVDPALSVDDDTAYRLQLEADVMTAQVTVFATDVTDILMAAELVLDDKPPHILVRAASGEEAAYFLQSEEEDTPRLLSRKIEWQQTAESKPVDERAVQLWSGEVLLASGEGRPGPFYVYEAAARAWAVSTALGMP